MKNMLYTFLSGCMAFLFAAFVWNVLFTVFTSVDKAMIGLILLVIVVFMTPIFYKFSYLFLGDINERMFSRHVNGFIQLDYSPLRVPSNAPNDYCKQFTDEEGNPIIISKGTQGQTYCGQFWRQLDDEVVMLPYKYLPGNKVEYWASPTLKIIGPITGNVKLMKDN